MKKTVQNILVTLDEFDETGELDLVSEKVRRKLRLAPEKISAVVILKRSLDARKRKAPHYCYTAEVHLEPEPTHPSEPFHQPINVRSRPVRSGPHVPVIVGTGPAGLFAAWRLTQQGLMPHIIERGPEVTERSRLWFDFLQTRHFAPEANLLFGEGGAGTYSDGKLTTRVHDPLVKEVLQVFVACGAPPDILYDAKPHVGSNYLPGIVRRMRQKMIEMGATFTFSCRLEGIISRSALQPTQEIRAIQTSLGEIPCTSLILAIGHSARDTYRMLHEGGVHMSAKPFQLGVRMEHPQDLINQNQYGKFCRHPHLPPAEYRLVAKRAYQNLDLYSFCMCPGGEILPAMEREGFLCVNGASKRARNSPFANSGLVITVGPERFDHSPLHGLVLQERIEQLAFARGGGHFGAPAQRVTDFLARRESTSLLPTSYPLGVAGVDFHEILPPFICEALEKGLPELDRKIKGYAGEQAMMLGPEARTCSPIRMDRDPDTREAIGFKGIYPIGEGAGYAGGIMSAAVDGLKTARVMTPG